jgi:hypothetical protein
VILCGTLFSGIPEKPRTMEQNKTSSSDPKEHTARISKEFEALIQHLREDIEKVDDPQAKALFEVSAEVIEGLQKAFSHYDKKSESAWQGNRQGS